MLLTEANKQAMPGADTSKWTDPQDIAKQLLEWLNQNHQINGQSIHIYTRQSSTHFEAINK